LLRRSFTEHDFSTEAEAKRVAMFRSKYSDHGAWRLGANSVTGTADTAYTVGTSAHPNYKFWAFNPRLQEVHFLEWQSMPASETFDETVLETLLTVSLYEAWYGTNGLVANKVVLRDQPGSGFVRVPSNILRPGQVRWERRVD